MMRAARPATQARSWRSPRALPGQRSRSRRSGRGALAAAVTLAGLALAAPAGADTLGPIDFESPAYVPGSINGQNGWSVTGPYDQAVVVNAGFPGAPPSFGAQSFRISNATTSGSFGDQTFSPSTVDETGESTAANNGLSGGTRQPVFSSEFTIASATGAVQPGLRITASPDRGDGARMSVLAFEHANGALEVDFLRRARGRGGRHAALLPVRQLRRDLARQLRPHRAAHRSPRDDLRRGALERRRQCVRRGCARSHRHLVGGLLRARHREQSESSARQPHGRLAPVPGVRSSRAGDGGTGSWSTTSR